MADWGQDFVSGFRAGGDAVDNAYSLVDRMAGRKSEQDMERQRIGLQRDKENSDLTQKMGMNSDQLKVAQANQDAVASGFPADATSPTGQYYGNKLQKFTDQMALGKQTDIEDKQSQSNERDALADQARSHGAYWDAYGKARSNMGGKSDLPAMVKRSADLRKSMDQFGNSWDPEERARAQAELDATNEYIDRSHGIVSNPVKPQPKISWGDTIGNIASGVSGFARKIAGIPSDDSDAPAAPKFKVNPKTGERIFLNPKTNQWEPARGP